MTRLNFTASTTIKEAYAAMANDSRFFINDGVSYSVCVVWGRGCYFMCIYVYFIIICVVIGGYLLPKNALISILKKKIYLYFYNVISF